MIALSPIAVADGVCDAERDLAELCPALAERSEWCRELSRTVADYCAAHYPAGQAPLDAYGLILARVLWSVGERKAAGRAVAAWCSDGRAASSCRILAHRNGPGIEWLPFCRSGLLRFDDSPPFGCEKAGCVLDVERLQQGGGLEMTVYLATRRIIEALQPFWAAQDGDGWLAIKGRFPDARPGSRKPRRRERGVPSDYWAFCADCLRGLATRNGWRHVPELKRMDLIHRN